jgi:hypothetical protein
LALSVRGRGRDDFRADRFGDAGQAAGDGVEQVYEHAVVDGVVVTDPYRHAPTSTELRVDVP